MLELGINAQNQQVPVDSTIKAIELDGFNLFNDGNYKEALTKYTTAADMRQKMHKEKDTLYVADLVFQGKCFFRMKNMEDAIDRAKKTVDYYGTNFSKSDENYAFYIDNLALYQGSTGNYSDAENNSREAVTIYEKLLKNDNDLAVMLEHLAENCNENGKHGEAIKNELRALGILKTVYGEHSKKYLDETPYLKKYYEDNGNDDKAEKLQENIDRLTKEQDNSDILISEMFETPERCHVYNDNVRYVAIQYLDCDLKKTNTSAVPKILTEWSVKSDDITIEIDSTVTSLMATESGSPYFIAFIAATIEYDLDNNIKRVDAEGLKQIKQRVEAFYKRNKKTTGKIPAVEKWFKE